MSDPNVKNIVGLALHLLNAHFDGLEAAAREHPAVYLALERRGLIGPRKADAVIVLERLYHALSDDLTISGVIEAARPPARAEEGGRMSNLQRELDAIANLPPSGRDRQAAFVAAWREQHGSEVWGQDWRCPLCNRVLQTTSADPLPSLISRHQWYHEPDWQAYAALAAVPRAQAETDR